jgi:hypothetical protein
MIPIDGTEQTATVKGFFRTELGKTLRIEELDDGGLRVEILLEGTWMPAPRGMIGLRLSKSTRRLTPQEILTLPV